MTMTLPQLFEYFADDMKAVETTLMKIASGTPHMEYVLKTGGHRWRPLLCILAFHYVGRNASETWRNAQSERLYALASALELIHTASLVHDDVIDESPTRRSQPALQVKTSNTIAVLTGNLFHLNAFRNMVSLNEPAWIGELIDTAEAMCLGEIVQLETQSESLTPEMYLDIIEKKTGRLIRASAKLGAALAGGTEEDVAQLSEIAGLMGLLYQLKDDLQDGDISNFDNAEFFALRKAKSQALEDIVSKMDMSSVAGQALIAIIQYFKE